MIHKFEDIEIEVIQNIKPQNKHIYVRLKDKQLVINTYKKLKSSDLDKIISANYAFIKKRLMQTPKDEDVLHILGIPYEVKLIESEYDEIKVLDSNVYIYTSKMDKIYIKKLIVKFYNELLNDYMINHYAKIFERFEDVVKKRPTYTFKMLKSCYGKYNKLKNEITLSSHLARYDRDYIELVVCHELCHTLYMNHQAGFYNLFEAKYKNAKMIQRRFKKIKYNDYF